jgi:DNA-binding NarL/FixJ family response regulator
MNKRLTVVIADDDPVVRRAIRDLLQDAGIIVAGEASNGREAVELAVHYRPDVILMDIAMPVVDGVMAARDLTRRAPGVRIVMLSNTENEDLVLLSFKVGALGFVAKGDGLAELEGAVRGAAEGEATIPQKFAMVFLNEIRRPSTGSGTRPVRSALTAREWEVLDLLAAGASARDIADQLVISPETVRSHTKNLRRKLGARSGDFADAAGRLRSAGARVRNDA